MHLVALLMLQPINKYVLKICVKEVISLLEVFNFILRLILIFFLVVSGRIF